LTPYAALISAGHASRKFKGAADNYLATRSNSVSHADHNQANMKKNVIETGAVHEFAN
jgi:hypothetical protein